MKRLLIAVAALLPVLAGVALAASMFGDAKSATARFHDIEQARDAGYTVTVADLDQITCIEDPQGTGAMGIHLLNPALLLDGGKIEQDKPEILVYEPRNDGSLKLVALEYLVFKSHYGSGRPSLFGQPFDEIDAVNRYGIPESWALHAWLWKPNPNGVLKPYNPSVDC